MLIFREYNFLRVQVPKDRRLRSAIATNFTVHRRVTEKERGRLNFMTMPEPCYEVIGSDRDDQQFYLMGAGFLPKLMKLLRKFKYQPKLIERRPPDIEGILRAMPDRKFAASVPWRDNQRDIMQSMIEHDRGQYIAATGSGKSWVIRNMFRVFNKARILVTTYSKSVLGELYKKVTDNTDLDIGLYTSSSKSYYGNRGMFVSLGSLHHFHDREWDILVLDEKHEACTVKRLQQLIGVKARRAYGLSAEESDRADNADMWAEAVFGPVRTRHSHIAAVKQGDVVPVKVRWVSVEIPNFPNYAGGDTRLERFGIWRNERRNELVAAEAHRCVDRFGQTLIYVKTVEHALVLHKYLGCPFACGALSKERMQTLLKQGVLKSAADLPTPEEVAELQEKFGKGDVDLVIATSVWKRGVDFPQLAAVVRADGSSSVEDAIQVTGRVTRTAPGKEFGVVVDFSDEFHDSLKQRAERRRVVYKREGYLLE